ncbi:MAG: 4a-hydroxytetrahydrobiopterin dehydratase [Gemmatimonadaceae bacterium]|nr:4a-hydroxytetrahydrobiopterin dehydratase [Gemmatimonadaceae bacterium]
MERLTDAAVAAALTELPGWKRTGDAITARYACAGFPEAIALHDAGGLTANDVALARQITAAAGAAGAEVVAT